MSDADAEPRAYTREEIRAKVFLHAWNLIDYWNTTPTPYAHGIQPLGDALDDALDIQRTRISGAVFSIFSMLDGSSMGLPGFLVTPNPQPEDEQYLRDFGENWFPEGVDIGGELHSVFLKHDPERTTDNEDT